LAEADDDPERSTGGIFFLLPLLLVVDVGRSEATVSR
jgi:hypothetical protein